MSQATLSRGMSLTCQPHTTRLHQVPRMVNSILLRELAAHLKEQRHDLRIQYRATTTEAAITEAAITEAAITEAAITEAILRRRVPERSHLTFFRDVSGKTTTLLDARGRTRHSSVGEVVERSRVPLAIQQWLSGGGTLRCRSRCRIHVAWLCARSALYMLNASMLLSLVFHHQW